jgi:GT2 family glycosyltransferase
LTVNRPSVSVVIPMRNEEKYIGKCLNGFINQTYPKEKYDIIIVDGFSDDDSISMVKLFQKTNDRIRIIFNKQRVTPVAFNLGINASKSEIVTIFSAHSIPSNNYIEIAVDTMMQSGADCVGGPMTAIGENLIGGAISNATSSPLGMGASVFHYSKKAQYVNTVYQGFFKRKIFDKIGLFDEELVRNQDDEMSYRLRKNGYKIYYDPNIKSVYYNRSSLTKLYKQYFQYGLYKPLVFRKLQYGMQIHHLIPSVFVLYLILIVSYFNTGIYLYPLIIYTALCGLFGIKSKSGLAEKLLTIVVYPILHISYGLGFIFGIPKSILFNEKLQSKT